MKDVWNEICYWLNVSKENNVLEKAYENTFVQCLGILGYKKYMGEIETQYAVQAGHETKRADIVVSLNGIEQFVVEVKRPGHIIQPEDEKQLRSYMRLVTHQVAFGLYIGNDIRLYYDNGFSPELIQKWDIISDNSDGETFVELFDRRTFDRAKLKKYCEEMIAAKRKTEELNAEVERLCSENGEELLREFLIEYISKKGYDRESVEEKLSDICISIVRDTELYSTIAHYDNTTFESRVTDTDTKHNRSSKRHWHYIFEGETYRNAGQLAYAIVERFVKDNSNLTYYEISRVLPRCVRSITKNEFSTKKEVSADKDFDKRWSNKFAPMLTSADNVEFAIHTGWNYWGYGDQRPHNICDLIEFARRQGYTVEEL